MGHNNNFSDLVDTNSAIVAPVGELLYHVAFWIANSADTEKYNKVQMYWLCIGKISIKPHVHVHVEELIR